MWDFEEDEECLYAEENHDISDNSVDSDVEAALYGQVHHEQPADDDCYFVSDKKTKISGESTHTKRTINKNAGVCTKLKKKRSKNFKNGDAFSTTKRNSKIGMQLSVTIQNEKNNVQQPFSNRQVQTVRKTARKKKEGKRKTQEVLSGKCKPQVIDLCEDSPSERQNFQGPSPKRKRKDVESKYDYSLERRNTGFKYNYSFERKTCHVSMQEDVDTTMALFTDFENEASRSKRKGKVHIKNNEAEIIRKIGETTGDLYNAFINYERDVLQEHRVNKKKSKKNNNIADYYNVVEISSSSGESHVEDLSMPVDIQLNVNPSVLSSRREIHHVNNQISACQNTVENKKTKNKKSKKKSAAIYSSAEEYMRHFYDSDEGEDYELDEVFQNMTGSWDVNVLDRRITKFNNKRYYFQNIISLRCVNCQEVGHTLKNCQKIRPVSRCYLCGNLNHSSRNCWSAVCTRCQLYGHKIKDCPLLVRDLKSRCKRCNMRGHVVETCPDHWRCYDLTTKPGELIQGNEEQSRKYCYNCGKEGHLGHACTKSRMSSSVFPNTPFISSYEKPTIPENDIYVNNPPNFLRRKKQRRKYLGLNINEAREKTKKNQSKQKLKKKNLVWFDKKAKSHLKKNKK